MSACGRDWTLRSARATSEKCISATIEYNVPVCIVVDSDDEGNKEIAKVVVIDEVEFREHVASRLGPRTGTSSRWMTTT